MLASIFRPSDLTIELKKLAHEQGFSRVGICRAEATPQFDRFREWIRRGYAGEMRYLSDRCEAFAHPDRVLAGVRSLVMLAMDYKTAPPSVSPRSAPFGRVARYALGEVDYHDLIHARLQVILGRLASWRPDAVSRGVVDSAPLHEREFARLAGLGWIGKNTLLIHPQAGSWCFLAAILTDLELDVDRPFEQDYCGTCTACLQACPTQAFPQPYVLDASRCISYLTIELRSSIPEPLRESISPWVFGCDVCQEVCPWNRFAVATTEPELQPRPITNPLNLRQLFYWSDAEFRRHFRHVPLWRTKRRGLLRNAALALGIDGAHGTAVPLIRGLYDREPLVRGACAWSLGRISNQSRVAAVLLRQLRNESHVEVRREISLALATNNRPIRQNRTR
ncbi:MAG: tRNA epoxyqueuosine(34) reductase QueG [Planctomycetota bacterium]|nr:tRNA epoxyqueuosine(34) reductase QueG [Planctomycetota bacterium]MDA1179657.1 tRNA epoxyqueuosine(34) reductase QueG [Planctomycetota bacterium]